MAKVLVADDAAFMRLRLRTILQGDGHEVVEAVNGSEAVDKFAAEGPQLVLLDITMPEMDGMAALAAIRQMDPAAKVVMCTALGQQNIILQAVRDGAADFIVKPFEPDRVKAAVRRLVS